jgi:hypothetical protein
MRKLIAIPVLVGALVAPATASAKTTMRTCAAAGITTIKVGGHSSCKLGRAVANRLLRGPIDRFRDFNTGIITVRGVTLYVARPNDTSYRAVNRKGGQHVLVDFHIVGG